MSGFKVEIFWHFRDEFSDPFTFANFLLAGKLVFRQRYFGGGKGNGKTVKLKQIPLLAKVSTNLLLYE
jgi:hypothetical protein